MVQLILVNIIISVIWNGLSTQASQSSALTLLKPTIELILPIHGYSKAKILPFTLGAIEDQDYPKNRTRVAIYLDIYPVILEPSFNSSDRRFLLNWLTWKIVNKWTTANQALYHDIDVNYNYLDERQEPLDDLTEYWNTERFSKMIKMKMIAMNQARNNWADYLFLIDADVVLVEDRTINHLVETGKPLVSPMLYSLGTYSNFWAGMNDKGYYQRTDDYLPILERSKVGTFQVPMIHSAVLIDLRVKATQGLTFNGSLMENVPYDDIISFAMSAKKNKLPMYILNEEIWGYIMPPVDTMDLERFDQDLIDLELEATIEGSFFPVAGSLLQFVQRPEKDKLGVDQVYVINLKRRKERREKMAKRMEILGIDGVFWEAIDGQIIGEQFLQERGVKILPGYLDPYHKRPMTFGEIGCFLSHYEIWLDMIKNNYEKIIIFEDDVRFERAFRLRFNQRLQAIRIYEEKFGPVDFVYLGRKSQDGGEEKIAMDGLIAPGYSYWTIGYLLTKTGAQKLIDAKPLEKLLPIDEFLPIMFDKHPTEEWVKYYPNRNLKALSVSPLLISPTHYVGDEQYLSDTEDSKQIIDLEGLTFTPYSSHNHLHPKHTEL